MPGLVFLLGKERWGKACKNIPLSFSKVDYEMKQYFQNKKPVLLC